MRKALLSLLAFGAVVSAAPVSVSFVNAGSPVVSAYGADVGPYTLSINGQNVKAMCMDDFNVTGGSWQANVTAVNGTDFSNTYLRNNGANVAGYQLTSGSVYSFEAYLYNMITQPGADRASIQEAAWAVMDPNTMNAALSSNNTKVLSVLGTAASNFQCFDTTGFEVLSQAGFGDHPQQEFIFKSGVSATPEPASFALFGGGLVVAGAARYFRRKK